MGHNFVTNNFGKSSAIICTLSSKNQIRDNALQMAILYSLNYIPKEHSGIIVS